MVLEEEPVFPFFITCVSPTPPPAFFSLRIVNEENSSIKKKPLLLRPVGGDLWIFGADEIRGNRRVFSPSIARCLLFCYIGVGGNAYWCIGLWTPSFSSALILLVNIFFLLAMRLWRIFRWTHRAINHACFFYRCEFSNWSFFQFLFMIYMGNFFSKRTSGWLEIFV